MVPSPNAMSSIRRLPLRMRLVKDDGLMGFA
jgi:hypothetical protein